MSRDNPVGPSQYAAIFEDHRVGAEIYEDLVKRYGHLRKGEGIDRLINMAEDRGRREVLDFITLRINQHNGVEEYET